MYSVCAGSLRASAASTAAGLKPSEALAAVIGAEPVARTQVIKKLWDYIKANGLQDEVLLVGKLTREHVIERYARAAVFVQPSRVAADGDRDGHGG